MKALAKAAAATTLAGMAMIAPANAVSTPTSSPAASLTLKQQATVKSLLQSKDPRSAIANASASQKALLKRAIENDIVTQKSTATTPRVASNQISTLAAGGCWSSFQTSSITLYGLSVGRITMQLNWCSNGSTITKYSTSPYGCTGRYGFDCNTKPVQYRNVGWEVRAAGTFHFSTTGIGHDVCGQTRNGKTGLYSTRMTCNLA